MSIEHFVLVKVNQKVTRNIQTTTGTKGLDFIVQVNPQFFFLW